MPNFFYTDANGRKQGPVNDQQLRTLAAKGVVTPHTPLEIDNGSKGLAGQLPGLFPAASSPSPSAASRTARTILKPAIILGISVVAVAGIVCLAMFLFGVSREPAFTAAERAEIDAGIALFGRNVAVHFLGSLKKDKDTDYNLILKYLKCFVSRGADVNAKIETGNGDGATPLLAAAAFGNVDIVKFLVSKGADVKVGVRGITPLHLAGDSKDKDVEVAKFLVSKGADVNAKVDKDHEKYGGSTPLHAAAEGNIEVVKFLVSKGVDVDAKNSTGQTPLLCAAAEGNIEVVKFLVSKGADVNAKDDKDKTALHHAVKNGDVEFVKFLVSQGANVNAKAWWEFQQPGGMYSLQKTITHNEQVTPLDLANRYRNEEIIQILSSGNIVGQRETTPPRRVDSPQRGGIQDNSDLGSASPSEDDVVNPDENRRDTGISGGYSGMYGGREGASGLGDTRRGGIVSPEPDEQEWGALNEQVAANATLIPRNDDSLYFFNSTYASYKDGGNQQEFLYIDSGGTARLGRWTGEGREMMKEVRSVYVLEGWNSSHTFFFITTNNELWAVGNNERGVVGDDTGLYRKEPVLVLSEVANLYFELNLGDRRYGNNAVHAIKTDKSRWSWGYGVKGGGKDAFAPIKTDDRFNYNQELLANHISMRNGNAESYPMMAIPNDIAGILGGRENILSAISLGSKKHILASIEMDEKGGRHYALTQDGVLWGWGNNNGGGLGDGTKADRDKPIKIAENVKRILPNYFVTKSNDWYKYSEQYYPKMQLQNVLYAYEFNDNNAYKGAIWCTPDGKLCQDSRSGRATFSVQEIVGNFKLPSIVRASDGQVIAPNPKQLVVQAAAPNGDDEPAEAEPELITFVKETNFLDACLPKRTKSRETEKMRKLTIGEAFDALPQFRQQKWEVVPGTDTSKTQVSLDFVIIEDRRQNQEAEILFTPNTLPSAVARFSKPPSVKVDGDSRKNDAFFSKIHDELMMSVMMSDGNRARVGRDGGRGSMDTERRTPSMTQSNGAEE